MENKPPLAAIIVAAGYGGFRPLEGRPEVLYPKVLEEVSAGEPMVVRVARTASQAGLHPIVAVGNPYSAALISAACGRAGLSVKCLIQTERTGTAEAALLAVPLVLESGANDAAIMYGDMPLWRAKTLQALISLHRARLGPVTMVTVSRTAEHPELDRYGRIIRDSRTKSIAGVVEPAVAVKEQLDIPTVNPSLWAWDLDWLQENVAAVPLRERGDGRTAERDLPPLVAIAYGFGHYIPEVSVLHAAEALGVNTQEELEHVRALVAANALLDPPA